MLLFPAHLLERGTPNLRVSRDSARRQVGRCVQGTQVQLQDASSVGAQQLFLERTAQTQVADRLDRALNAVRNIRKVAAEDDAVLKLQHALDRRRAAQEIVEHQRRVEVDAVIQAAQVEEGVKLIGASV